MEPDTVTPSELARDLGVSPKTVRAQLRNHYGTQHPRGARWHLTEEQVRTVRSYFDR